MKNPLDVKFRGRESGICTDYIIVFLRRGALLMMISSLHQCGHRGLDLSPFFELGLLVADFLAEHFIFDALTPDAQPFFHET